MMKSLPYFLGIPSDPHFCLYKILENAEHEYYIALIHDLNAIDENELNQFCIKYNITCLWKGRRTKTWKEEFGI